MVRHQRISTPLERRRMMGPESLEVTRTFLSSNCASLCKGSSCHPYGLSKGLLVKSRWCLTSTSWTTSTSSPATSHLHMSNDKLSFNEVSLRYKYSLETLFTYRKKIIHNVNAFIGNARQTFHILNHPQTKILFFLYPVNSVHDSVHE